MIFTKSSRKRTAKVSSDDTALSFDLLSQLTHMAALATGGASRDLLLESVIQQDFKTGVYFRQVYVLAKKVGFEYSRAYRTVAQKAGADSIKNLLLRFAGAINSGVEEAEFLAEEARVEREQYVNAYHRKLETLSKWGDAYAALLVSVALIVVVAMISTMLSNFTSGFVVMLSAVMVMTTGGGVYVIYRTAPVETTTFQNRRGPKGRWWAKRLMYTLFPVGVLVALYAGYSYGMGMLLLIIGISMLPSGFLAVRDNARVTKLDQEGATFIRSLGHITASLNSTLSAAMAKIDRRSLGGLEPHVNRLQIRLRRQIQTEKCWNAFRDEVGSHLMNRATRMFVEGVSLGGPPEKVGAIASAYAMDSAMMRSRRTVTAAPFAFLCMPLHFAMTALMVFVFELMQSFNERIETMKQAMDSGGVAGAQAAMPSLPVFQGQDMGLLSLVTLAALLSMTVSNALAPAFALGGHPLNAALYGGMTCVMTGLNLSLIPPVASQILATSPA